MKKIQRYVLAGLALMACAMPVSAEKLVILHTNDTHSQIDPAPDDGLGGVGRRKVLIDSVRAAADNTLLVDAGDVVQGTLFFNVYKGEVEEKMMNALGYELRILGNHEFDNGLELLADNLRGADATLLASNYLTAGTPLEGLFQPYTIKEYDGKRLAFMAINLNPAGMITPVNYEGMGYVDAIGTANNLAWYLKNFEKADMVIALTHIGYMPYEPPGDVMLAGSSTDIDMIIGGHSHTYLNPDKEGSDPWFVPNADGREILVAQAGKGGRYLGEITIDLDSLTAKPSYRLIPVDSRLDDRVDGSIEEMLAPYRVEIEAMNTRKVGKTARALDKDSEDLLNWVTDIVAYRGRQMADDVDFAMFNRGGIRSSLPKGDITESDVIVMMPFFNRVEVIDILGSDVLEALDRMAQIGGSGVSAEVSATFDPSTGKCTEVTISGQPLDPDRLYRVATIDYVALGGDYMQSMTRHTDVASSKNHLYEDMLDYLRTGPGKGKKINPPSTKRMRAK